MKGTDFNWWSFLKRVIAVVSLGITLVFTYRYVMAHEAPFKITIRAADKSKDYVTSQFDYFYEYTISALENGLIINNVTVNNGKCDIDVNGPIDRDLDVHLNYSHTWTFGSLTDRRYKDCIPKEVFVKTNMGNYTMHFN